MNLTYKEYTINIFNDQEHTFNSADNLRRYDVEHTDDTYKYYRISQYGITIENEIEPVKNIIIGETGGATRVHERSALIKHDCLFVCCGFSVYSFNLPNLNLIWHKRLDPATCFGLYNFKDDIIVHGELEVTRFDVNGNLKWGFGARDIFATPAGDEAFKIVGNHIEITDFEGYKYVLDEDGNEISSK